MTIMKPTVQAAADKHSPELVDNWVLITGVEAIILALLLPALFRLGLTWGLVVAVFVLFLLGAAYTWRKGKPVGYHFFAILYSLSFLALAGAIIIFLSVVPLTVSLIFISGAYLAGYLNWKEQRGYRFIIQALVVVIAIIALVVRLEEARFQIYLLLGFLALYLFCGGAVRFYFGHTFAELDQPDVLTYFGYNQLPAVWRRAAAFFGLPGQWLQTTYKLLDTLLARLAKLFGFRSTLRRGVLGQARLGLRKTGRRVGAVYLPGGRGRRVAQMGAIVIAVINFPYLIRQLEDVIDISILISMNVGLLFVVLALGLNIVVGFAGLLDLGYAAFFAIGAYTVGIFTWPNLGLEWSFWIVIWLSTLVAALFGLIIGAPTLRLRGDYLAIVTLAFGEIVPRAIRELWNIKLKIPFTDIYIISAEGLFYNSQGKFVEGFNLTNGPQGMNPVGRPILFGFEVGVETLRIWIIEIPPPIQWYLLIVILGSVVLFASFRLQNSRLGRAWMAIREDETAADTMGVDPVRTKLLAFALGASFSGFAGSMYAAMIQAIFPELFSFLVSIFLLIIVIVSGMGNIWGVLVGGLLIALFDRVVLAQIVPQFVPGGDILQSWRWVMYAAGLIAIMILRPEGLFPSAVRKAELHETEEELRAEDIALVLEQ